MRVDLISLLTAVLWSLCVATPRYKRQGLFFCSGWGASCTNWKNVLPDNITPLSSQPAKPALNRVPELKVKPKDTRTRFWLTTDKGWGPRGKRFNNDNKSDRRDELSAILSILRQQFTQQLT